MLIAEATTMASLLTTIGDIFHALIGYVGDICTAITSQPVLLIGFAIPFTFAVVTFVKKLFYVG